MHPQPRQRQRAKRWCMTLNNWQPHHVDMWRYLEDELQYGIMGYEMGESGTPHLQGFLHFKKLMEFSHVKTLFPEAHLTIARGTDQDNQAYCSKSGHFEEVGSIPITMTARGSKGGQATQEKWKKAKLAAQEGHLEEVDAQIYVTHYNNLKAISRDNIEPLPTLDGEFHNLWIWGPPGTGKSRFARFLSNNKHYDKNCNKWWDGYSGESDVLIDDFDQAHGMLGHHMKRWADRYAFLGETKGSSKMIRPQRVIVTSNHPPENINWDETTKAAVSRRFKVLEMETLIDPDLYAQLALDNNLAVHITQAADIPSNTSFEEELNGYWDEAVDSMGHQVNFGVVQEEDTDQEPPGESLGSQDTVPLPPEHSLSSVSDMSIDPKKRAIEIVWMLHDEED